jgi:transposase-like protein
MPRGTKFTAERIIGKLREAEVEMSRGKKVPEVCRKLGVTEQTYYPWKKKYGGLRIDQAKRLKELEKENARLLIRAPSMSRRSPCACGFFSVRSGGRGLFAAQGSISDRFQAHDGYGIDVVEHRPDAPLDRLPRASRGTKPGTPRGSGT